MPKDREKIALAYLKELYVEIPRELVPARNVMGHHGLEFVEEHYALTQEHRDITRAIAVINNRAMKEWTDELNRVVT